MDPGVKFRVALSISHPREPPLSVGLFLHMCLSIRFQVAVSVRRVETIGFLALPEDEADAVGSNLSS